MRSKTILIIGSGGREHALGWKLKQSPAVKKIYFAPGNAGTSQIGENVALNYNDLKGLLNFAKEKKVDLTVVGPEEPLVMGIVDLFKKHGLKIFGPSKKAAQIEGSKIFSKRFMKRFKIPTAKFKVFENYQVAKKYLHQSSFPQVIKADCLAAGKGVIVAKNLNEGLTALKIMMKEKKFGEAGKKVVIEDCLIGQEASIICLTDGQVIKPLLVAQDHKAIFDGDKGPNTGGMGAYAPAPIVNQKLIKEITVKVLKPTIRGMKKIGRPYQGVLYAGIMLTSAGLKVLEFNCRFGDPETQIQLIMLKSDLVKLIEAVMKIKLKNEKIVFYPGASVCVALASGGYPGHYEKGEEIHGLDKIKGKNLVVFHAGTTIKNNKVVTNGGRVLGITSYGKNIKEAIKKVYGVIGKKGVFFRKMAYRKDIGQKAFLKKI
jgi:phosphoribosylamine--glycine ligase